MWRPPSDPTAGAPLVAPLGVDATAVTHLGAVLVVAGPGWRQRVLQARCRAHMGWQ